MELRAQLPDDALERIAERAAELVLERMGAERNGHESELLTVAEAAEFLRSSRQRVYDLLSDGRLRRHKDGSRVLVSRSELVAHLRPTASRCRTTSGVAG